MKDLTPQLRELIWRVVSDLTGLPQDRIESDTPLLSDGYLTSLQVVEIVNTLERETGVIFQDEDITPENFETPRAMSALLKLRGDANTK